MNKKNKIQNKIQLIVYPDSLGRDLKDLYYVLNKFFKKEVRGVHILPFYPSTSDRGFSPIDQAKIDKRFGTWRDVKRIAKKFDVLADLIVNHISSQSVYFQDFLEKAEDSKYSDYFIEKKSFLGRRKEEKAIKKMYRVQPASPFRKFIFQNGETKEILGTFSSDQIDLNVENFEVRKMLKGYIKNLANNKVKFVRLDAIGYAIKISGTRCFMLRETYEFINWLSQIAHENGLEVLPEVHYNYKTQIAIANQKEVDWGYDFALSIIVLHAIFSGSTKYLKNWIRIRPTNLITTLDNHDGIGVVDARGLMPEKELTLVKNMVKIHGGNATKRATGRNCNNVDVYQINITYYSALGEVDDRYLLARAVQFFLPGIPQIYYVGLLAGKNDFRKVKRTKVGRDINRHNYSLKEIEKRIKNPLVQKIMKLMRFRNEYPAFNGEFKIKKSSQSHLLCEWRKDEYYCELQADFFEASFQILYWDKKTKKIIQLSLE